MLFTLCCDNVRKQIEAEDQEEAYDAAETWGLETDTTGDESETFWVTVEIRDENDVKVDKVKVAINPMTPNCGEDCGPDEHEWVAPHEWVGGVEENPGVFADSGGARVEEGCRHCGCGRTTRTCAQDPVDGEQGLTSVKYTPDAYTHLLRQQEQDEDAA